MSCEEIVPCSYRKEPGLRRKNFFLRLTEKEPKNETGRELLPLQAYPFTFSPADKMLNTFDNAVHHAS